MKRKSEILYLYLSELRTDIIRVKSIVLLIQNYNNWRKLCLIIRIIGSRMRSGDQSSSPMMMAVPLIIQ